jgi:hypothetical protein
MNRSFIPKKSHLLYWARKGTKCNEVSVNSTQLPNFRRNVLPHSSGRY